MTMHWCFIMGIKPKIAYEYIWIYYIIIFPNKRLRWSRGSVLTFDTQVRGFKPGRSRRFFQGEKILSKPSSEGK
jgi:hypothetical protein